MTEQLDSTNTDWIAITNVLRKHHGTLARAARSAGLPDAKLRRLNRGELKKCAFVDGLMREHDRIMALPEEFRF